MIVKIETKNPNIEYSYDTEDGMFYSQFNLDTKNNWCRGFGATLFEAYTRMLEAIEDRLVEEGGDE